MFILCVLFLRTFSTEPVSAPSQDLPLPLFWGWYVCALRALRGALLLGTTFALFQFSAAMPLVSQGRYANLEIKQILCTPLCPSLGALKVLVTMDEKVEYSKLHPFLVAKLVLQVLRAMNARSREQGWLQTLTMENATVDH